MSKLTETKRAYDRVRGLLDRQLLEKKGDARQIRDAQEAVDAAFYLLGWAQFEYVTRKEAERLIKIEAAVKNVQGTAWRYVLENIKAFTLRRKLEVIFQADQPTLAGLLKNYEIRNEAAHNYKSLPPEARDVSEWLESLERLVERY